MTAAALPTGEPVASPSPATGSVSLPGLDDALALARAWAGKGLETLLLSGSHAAGEGVWTVHEGRPLTLSDVDVYAVVRDAAAARAAEASRRAERGGLAARLLAMGIAAPLDVAFLTRDGLSRLPARPGTIELARRAHVIAGDPSALALVPRWRPADVSREQTTLLLENRAFELLLWPPAGGPVLTRLQARHARLKVATDLAAVLALDAGELPEGTPARVAWARARASAALAVALPAELAPAALDRLWSAAVEWRGGVVTALEPGADEAEWRAAARAWSAVWWAHGEREARGVREPWARALRMAARASLHRRVRRALTFVSRTGEGPALGAHLRSLLAGTPQHRVHGSAAVLLLAAATSATRPALSTGALRALRRLGVTPASDWEGARRDVVRAWDRWLLDGQRTAAVA